MDLFNRELKNKAIERLKGVEIKYNSQVKIFNNETISLYKFRDEIMESTINTSERILDELASAPSDFRKNVEALKTVQHEFHSHAIIKQDDKNTLDTMVTGGVGSAIGIGAAALAPTAMMAIATTFGTASTGVAISTLSGAAAANAALAWLGGGALTAGGAGMAGGGALLALAGPMGWIIGGGAVTYSIFKYASNNSKIAKDATDTANKLNKQILKVDKFLYAIKKLYDLTKDHNEMLLQQQQVIQTFPKIYDEYTDEQKKILGSYINNINSLCELIQRKV